MNILDLITYQGDSAARLFVDGKLVGRPSDSGESNVGQDYQFRRSITVYARRG
jgi:hypothetical protein